MAKVQILEGPLNELERFFEAGLKVESSEIDRQKEQLTINHERTYYLQKEKDLELQKLKRQANLQKFNNEVKTTENKYEVIKNFDDDENQRLEEYIDQKTKELKARDQFQEFSCFLQEYFEDSRFDGNDSVNLTEEEITTIEKEFKEKSQRANNQFKIHFDIFNEVIESLRQIYNTEKFQEQLEKVSTELQIDKDELSKRINPQIIRSDTDITEASVNKLEDIEDKGPFILVSESGDRGSTVEFCSQGLKIKITRQSIHESIIKFMKLLVEVKQIPSRKNPKEFREEVIENFKIVFQLDFNLFKKFVANALQNTNKFLNKNLISDLDHCKKWHEISFRLVKYIIKHFEGIVQDILNYYSEKAGKEITLNNYDISDVQEVRLLHNAEINLYLLSRGKVCTTAELTNYTDDKNYGYIEERHKEKYHEIVQAYQQTYQYYTKEQIREYGENTKNQRAGYAYDDGSAIAAIIRANEISTGHRLRKIQILAILEFLADKNKFCQIDTGEGKTTITSALAVISTLRGETVDIITSNQVLAEDAVRERGDFYTLFGISVTHNNPDLNNPYVEGLKECYTHDVVYGTIGAFAFDYLHNSVEALGTKVLHMKNGIPVIRECDTVIIDEADNVILDNYALITNQAKSVAGVDQIKFIYIDIWQKIIKAEKELCIDQLNITDKDKKVLKEQINKKEIEAKIDQDERIPRFLKEFVKKKLDLLIDNAIKAKYDLHVDEDYVINKKDDEDNILPLEKDIGVRLQNFIWTDLHPFLQMKHNLHVNSCGSLTSVFIPNCGYLKLHKKIYGLTGTLGSSKEQEFTKNIFGVDSTIIPAFKQNQRKHIKEMMCRNENEWLDSIADVAKEYSKIQQRAVLFVCDTPNAVKKIEQKLMECGYKDIKIYENESDAYKIENINKSGGITQNKIIISTNIGGRGTDIKLSTDVERHGGLHEVTTYLPRNQRTQKQAAGRAARSGQPGSNQIIFQQSEVSELEKLLPENVLMELKSKYNPEYLQKVIRAGVGLNKLRDDIKFQLSSTKLNGIPIAIENELISADEQKDNGVKGLLITITKDSNFYNIEDLDEAIDFTSVKEKLAKLEEDYGEVTYKNHAFQIKVKDIVLFEQSQQEEIIESTDLRKEATEFVLLSSESIELSVNTYAFALRDKVEEIRLKQAESHLNNLLKQYQLFKKFENYYYYLKKYKQINHFILEDLKLKFGLCYDEVDKTNWDNFFQEIDSDIKTDYVQYKFANSNYAIKYAQSLIRSGEFDQARQVLSGDKLCTNITDLFPGVIDDFYKNAYNQRNNRLYLYQAGDFCTLQKQIFSKYQDVKTLVLDNGKNKRIGPSGNSYTDDRDIKIARENLREQLQDLSVPKLVYYNISNEHWVFFAAVEYEGQVNILYKDSQGNGNAELEKQIEEIITDKAVNFIYSRTKEQTEGVECGIFALENMRIIAEIITQNPVYPFAKAVKLFKDDDLQVIALSDDEVLEPSRTNTIAIQIATNPGVTDPTQEEYEYYYRIIFSADLSPESVNEIIDNIERELHITCDIDSKNFKAREVIETIGFARIPAEAILDDEVPDQEMVGSPIRLSKLKVIRERHFNEAQNFAAKLKESSFSKFCSLDQAIKFRREDFAKKFVLGKYQEMVDSAIRLSKLKVIRERHFNEAQNFATKLKESSFVQEHDLQVIALSDDEVLEPLRTNTIAIQIATNPGVTDPIQEEYEYYYRIIFSADLSPESVNEIIDNIERELHITCDRDSKNFKAREVIETIGFAQISPEAILDDEISFPNIKMNDLLDNLYVPHQSASTVIELLQSESPVTRRYDQDYSELEKKQDDSPSFASVEKADSSLVDKLKDFVSSPKKLGTEYYEGEFDIFPAYHFAMFEIELSKGFNVFYRLLEGITSISLDSNALKTPNVKKNAISHLNKAKTLLQKRLKEITQLIDSEEFRKICLSKEDQEYNFGDNMMQRHLESEQSLIIATIAHAEELARLIESNLDGNKQIVLKKTYSFKQIIENSLEIDLSIDGISKSEIALADSVGLGVYYEIEVLANLGSDDPEVKAARLKIAGGAAMLLLAYIPQTRIVTPAIAIPAGKLIRRGTKKLLSLIFNDPNIDDEVDDIEDYVLDIATSFSGPATVVPKILKTVLMQVGQSFLVNYLIKNFGKELLDIIKDKFGVPIKALIEKPLRKIYEWKEFIFSQLKKTILDPVRKTFQWLLGRAKDVMGEIFRISPAEFGDESSSTDIQENILDKIQKVKKFLFEIIEDITWVKDKLFRGWYDSLDIFNQLKKIKKFKNFFSDFKKGLIKAIKSLTGVIKGFVEGDLLESIKTIITRVKDIVESIITSIPQYIERIVNQAKDLYVLIKEIINTITRDPIGFFRWLINYMPAFIQAEIFNKGYDLLANIMRGIMSKIEEIFDSIFRNNPIDKFLNKYGIDLSNPGTMINKICSYAVDMIIGFVKSMIFQPPKQVNEDGVESSHNAVDEAVHKSTRSQQCVPFSLTKLFNISEEELLNVTRTYISTKITADQGLTDWQTKFIIEDLGLKVFKENKDQESQYATIAIQYLKNCSSVGGIGLFVRLDKRGHAYFISETESVRFIDEANPEGVIDLTTEDYTKGTFLIPMNFSQNRRSEISKRIKENPNPNDSFVFMFWLRRIWEKLFPGQTFGTDSISNQTTFINQVVPKSKNINEIRRQIKTKTKILEKDQNNAKAQAELIQLKQKVKNFESKYVKTVELLITEVNLILNEISKTIPRIIANHIQIVLVQNNYAEGRVWQLSIKEKKLFQTWSIVLAQQFFKKNPDYQTKLITAITSSTTGVLDMYKNCSITFNTRLPKFKDNSNTFCGNFEIIFKDNPQNQIITWNFHSYTTGILLKEYEHAVDPGLLNNQDAVAYDLQKGTNSNDLMHLTGISELFYEYTMEGIRHILGLRLSTEASISGLTNTLVLPGSYIFGEKHSNIHTLLFYLNLYIISIMLHRNKHAMKRVNPPVILTPISLHGKHAVGIMFVAQGDGSGYKAFYLDPENTDIPEGLAIIFKDNGYQIEQLPTEGQLYTNCGPEVIENFMLYLTGERLSQEDAIVNNSRLVEQELLSSSHDAEEASCLTLKDSYSKEDAVTVISNTAYNTQVSSDDYAIGNPTTYDIITPQTIIDEVVVSAELGIEPHDVLLELVHDYRINQDYAEAIIGEVTFIDIS